MSVKWTWCSNLSRWDFFYTTLCMLHDTWRKPLTKLFFFWINDNLNGPSCGHLNDILARVGGNLNNNIINARGVAWGGDVEASIWLIQYVCPSSEFQHQLFCIIEEEAMLLLVFYNCICSFLCQCLGFNPSLCCFSPFLLSYVTVSRPCCLLESIPTGPQCMHVS